MSQAALTDLLDDEAGQVLANTADVEEVTHYLCAVRLVRDNLRIAAGLPISVRLLCDAHRLLLDGARDAGKQPDKLRSSQNWVDYARPGRTVFVPLTPEHLPGLLADLERSIHDPAPEGSRRSCACLCEAAAARSGVSRMYFGASLSDAGAPVQD
jgi:Fic family protein